ncbi:hypothetical protein Cylst_1546 [Cylindrospermum stagnale PCC 7417]|uniref:Uncharacterized protein n=1 Tax=Cylindrospermum stagnale PCC 7417 TaxID=56107 RepID=K9WTW8_9NOST|nr:hypothetical protein [Cylindrospermum stagnale]AFZ23830.1 hypothetical protein Cylst_1546 [Cylindrospermum stagnale PCC 7417]
MSYDDLWHDTPSLRWMKALSLPILPWAKPFVAIIGLPDALVENLEVWASIYAKAVLEKKRLEITQTWPVERRGEPIRLVVTQAMQELAEQLGRDVAIDFERWAQRHFFCHEVEVALSRWRSVLNHGCVLPLGSRKTQVPPPPVLMPIVPEIATILDRLQSYIIEREIDRVAPLSPYKMWDEEELGKCFEATMLTVAMRQTETMKALQAIAKNLNQAERQEVAAWGIAQALALSPRIKPETLCGDKYLQIELPWCDFPSVLDSQSDIYPS